MNKSRACAKLIYCLEKPHECTDRTVCERRWRLARPRKPPVIYAPWPWLMKRTMRKSRRSRRLNSSSSLTMRGKVEMEKKLQKKFLLTVGLLTALTTQVAAAEFS